jgi:dihydroorotate dehydrogenase (fumarate)
MNLTTRYLGLTLRNPLIAGASPLTGELDNVRRLADLGAGAVVLPSIFEEQVEHEQQLIEQLIATGNDSYSEALTYFPAPTAYAFGPERYLDLVRRAAGSVEIPVIASLNGVTDHGWTGYARELEGAGAHAIELNIYFIPSDLELSGHAVEQRYVDVVTAVKGAVKIPVSVKIGPYFSSVGDMARRLVDAGADGLVLFNRFFQPDIDLTGLALISDLDLSQSYEIRLPLLWIGVLSGRVKASLAASTGVDSSDDVVKFLLAGADTVMTASALLRHGIGHIKEVVGGLETWLGARDVQSLDAIRGRMSHRHIVDPTAYERAHYIKTLQGYKTAAP